MIDLNRLDAFLSASQAAQGLRLSVYLPTHRIHPDNKADPILYKNQLLKLQATLEKEHPARGWEGLLKRMEALLEEGDLWRHTAQGLGVLAAGERVESFILERSAEPLATAGACFHLLPLYHQDELVRDALLVDLSRDRYQAYQVSQNRLTPLHLEDVKDSFTALFDDPDLDANRDKMGHLRDREKYLRYLHEAFLRLHKEEGTQVILAGTRDTLSQFRSLAQSAPYLIGAIEQPLETLSDKQILSSARDILQPLYRAWLAALSTELSNAHNAGKALTDLGEIRAAAREGRVGKLVISAQPPAGTLKTLDQVVSDALQSAATILVVDQADKPLSRDHAAILRY
ncbi:MAG: hypothetical protein AB9880_09030 [Christensenellales bacterium]